MSTTLSRPEDFSSVEPGIDGAHFHDKHRRRDRFAIDFLEMPAADKVLLDQLDEAVTVGQDWFFCWDKDQPSGKGAVTGTTYGYLAEGIHKQYVPGPSSSEYWTYSFLLHEAL